MDDECNICSTASYVETSVKTDSMAFIDLEKAYDRVPRQEVWRCMTEKGVSAKYVRTVRICTKEREQDVQD